MFGLLDYLDHYGHNTLQDAPFNNVDNLIFAELIYLDFEDILFPLSVSLSSKSLRTIADEYAVLLENGQRKTDELVNRYDISLLKKMAETNRFGNMGMCCYSAELDLEIGKQFAAVVYTLDEQTHYLAFRGTDNTLMGWKEDFAFSYLEFIPSQKDALAYLNAVFEQFSGNFYVGGHSKGGNLAVYAATQTTAENKARILQVYNNDGPGFWKDFVESEPYTEILPKIITLIPQFSIIGLLLEQKGERIVVDSNGLGFAQHLPNTWKVDNNDFVRAQLRETAILLNQVINNWMDHLSLEQRKVFTDTVFDIFGSSDGEEVIVPLKESLTKLQRIKERYENVDASVKEEMESVLDLFKQEMKETMQASIKSIFSGGEKDSPSNTK